MNGIAVFVGWEEAEPGLAPLFIKNNTNEPNDGGKDEECFNGSGECGG